MKPLQFQVNVTIDGDAEDALVELVQRVVKRLAALQSDRTPPSPRHHGSAGRHEQREEQPLLVDNRQAAKLLQVSPRKLWGMQASGEVPGMVRFGRLVRWNYEVLQEWINAGCPSMSQ